MQKACPWAFCGGNLKTPATLVESLGKRFSDRGSIPLISTTSLRTAYRSQRLFCKSHFSLILSQLLSESNPLRWASIRVFVLTLGIFFVSMPGKPDIVGFPGLFCFPGTWWISPPSARFLSRRSHSPMAAHFCTPLSGPYMPETRKR